jgi:cytochrome c oxidase assembly protein Cox11
MASDRDAAGVRELTLSYTFYPVKEGERPPVPATEAAKGS